MLIARSKFSGLSKPDFFLRYWNMREILATRPERTLVPTLPAKQIAKHFAKHVERVWR